MGDFAPDIPPGIVLDDTPFSVARGAWRDCNLVRFWRGRAEVVGGWERLQVDLLTGVCRAVLAWTDGIGANYVAWGTHSALQVNYGGDFATITPAYRYAATLLGAAPFAVTNGSPVVTVTHPLHGLATGAQVNVSGAAAVGGITPTGNYTITVTTPSAYTITHGSNAGATTTGGGAAVVVQPTEAFAAGSVDGTGGAGYGTGTYSTGPYSAPSTADYFPRTWSLATWGAQLMACPRGGSIYWWQGSTATPAAGLRNAPKRSTVILVTPQRQVMAFGTEEEATGVFNPLCIRASDIRNPELWATAADNNAQEEILTGSGRIVSAKVVGEAILVWSDRALYVGTFTGDPGRGWRFDCVAEQCGLIGVNAAAVVGQRAFWISPEGMVFGYMLGGEPFNCLSPVAVDMMDNLATVQADKIVASTFAARGEVRFDYPDDRDGPDGSGGLECSRYVAFNYAEPIPKQPQGTFAWGRGTLARSAYIDAGPQGFPIGVAPTGEVYFHERNNSADGAAFSAWLESADLYADESDHLHAELREWAPDFQGQTCPVQLTLYGRPEPKAAEKAYGPWVCGVTDTRKPLRARGRLVRLRFESFAAVNFWRVGRPVFDVLVTGKR